MIVDQEVLNILGYEGIRKYVCVRNKRMFLKNADSAFFLDLYSL